MKGLGAPEAARAIRSDCRGHTNGVMRMRDRVVAEACSQKAHSMVSLKIDYYSRDL